MMRCRRALGRRTSWPIRTWCQTDHSTEWAAHGATVPRDGQPLRGRHNRLKERGYKVHRDDAGTWHVIHPDGTEIR